MSLSGRYWRYIRRWFYTTSSVESCGKNSCLVYLSKGRRNDCNTRFCNNPVLESDGIIRLFDDAEVNLFQQIINIISRSGQINRFGQIKAENSHQRFCINDIPAGKQVYIIRALGHDVNKLFAC